MYNMTVIGNMPDSELVGLLGLTCDGSYRTVVAQLYQNMSHTLQE